MSASTQAIIDTVDKYSAHNYERFPDVVAGRGSKGVWMRVSEGDTSRDVLDMFACYATLALGHNHSAMRKVLLEQFTIASHEFRTEEEADLLENLCRISGMGKVLPKNSGTEAIEGAVKLAHAWARRRKGVSLDTPPEIISAYGNFHGRTYAAMSLSTTAHYKDVFGPHVPGSRYVPYGDASAIRNVINSHTAAVVLEPIQGEAGIIIPPDGYLARVQEICREQNVLFMLDEVQTGFGRTGKMFCFEREGLRPDVLIVAKALGGGLYPTSAILASEEVMDVIESGEDGSTMAGNALACAIGAKTIEILESDKLVVRSSQLGAYLLGELKKIRSPLIQEVRGRGLFIGIELAEEAGDLLTWRKELLSRGVVVGQARHRTLRVTPPLIVIKKELDLFLSAFKDVVGKFSRK